ncbi:DNA ligase D [Sphingobacterium phlebotomi]|uniref:DNA ligase (ATP) n=1 Tax=Sphingobacterium phlebotomi TaxID=2605433 RepID=A0A5D4H610_9SPHI|nr:DNA ligase D [Sphingobacterium phlebotomi]TYR36501.1 DNA ligase D [Sphingobacterium phlebotomi]
MAKLADYNKKRNFKQTHEPKGGSNDNKSKPKKLRFVVQRHHASRLHYDVRLELDGVLKSWAVPKGPSLYPKDKRLAMQVEDHPIDYASFEGIIPKGNYGAGVVTIFDSGYYEFTEARNAKEFLQALKKGSLKFKLHGHILRGEFALVRMKGQEDNAWLLIKHKDRYAWDEPYDSENSIQQEVKQAGIDFKKDKTVELPKPMLAKLADHLPEGTEWRYEKKYDGFRILATRGKGGVQLYSRNGKDMNALFPSVVEELSSLDKYVWLDGELVIEDKQGNAHFQLIASGEPIPSNLTLRYYVFDILRLEDEYVTDYALKEREELLALLFRRIKKTKIVRLTQILQGTVQHVKAKAEKEHWEGVIAKETNSTYLQGKRSSSWTKFKLRNSQEAVICGYTSPQGSRSFFGALVLGYYRDGELVYIGNCGTGFNTKSLKNIYATMQKQVSGHKPFDEQVTVAKEKEVTWLRPLLVCDVYYSEWTTDGRLRHPVFKGLREDKDAEEIEKEDPMKNEKNEDLITIGRKKVQLTNLNKVYWPKEHYIKGQMIAYYEQIADYILPFIKNKPISMHRFPNGITAEGFFQKDVDTDNIPDWVKTAPIHSESTGKETDYIVCNDKATLLYIANLGSIEVNPWLSTYQKPEHPDFAVLDLDPNGTDFQELIQVAKTTHEIFEELKVPAFLKTSGSTGLHIYIYLNKKYTYDVARDFIELVAQMVQEKHSNTTSLVRDPKKRKGMIYLDFLQNRRGQTIAAPYSLRPKEGATASAPLRWDELTSKLRIADYNIKTMLKRVKEIGNPWATLWDSPVNIKQVLAKL